MCVCSWRTCSCGTCGWASRRGPTSTRGHATSTSAESRHTHTHKGYAFCAHTRTKRVCFCAHARTQPVCFLRAHTHKGYAFCAHTHTKGMLFARAHTKGMLVRASGTDATRPDTRTDRSDHTVTRTDTGGTRQTDRRRGNRTHARTHTHARAHARARAHTHTYRGHPCQSVQSVRVVCPRVPRVPVHPSQDLDTSVRASHGLVTSVPSCHDPPCVSSPRRSPSLSSRPLGV